ncbi:Transcriptional regulatory moc3 [Paramyrothecium foliicola]|nr:Transcriptional regulatory moc3 [Paramyrothecium foliicola]
MLAISAYHHLGPASAFPYKLMAFDGLSKCLGNSTANILNVDVQSCLAASLMLCMYNVFDEAEGHFHVHLSGAQSIVHGMLTRNQSRLQCQFLLNWFLYYAILGQCTQQSWSKPQDSISLLLKAALPSDCASIVGCLGCSIEVFDIIHQINALRMQNRTEPGHSAMTVIVEERMGLEIRLQNLYQRLDDNEMNYTTTSVRAYAVAKAELYRIAALLFLQRAVPLDGDESRRVLYLGQAWKALRELDVATGPWPVFVVACESYREDERMEILEILDQMDRHRDVGNVHVMRRLIEVIWKQHDLKADPTDLYLKYKMSDSSAIETALASLRASPSTIQVLRDLHSQALAEEPFTSTSGSIEWALDKFVALDPDKCALVYLLLRSTRARFVVEAGTSFGVSTIWLALAVGQNALEQGGPGKVIATENESKKAARARENWKAAGAEVEPWIELREGDLQTTLETDLPEQIDFLLLDIWTPLALPALVRVKPRLRIGAMIVSDNLTSAAKGYKDLVEYLEDASNGFKMTTAPYSGGLGIAVYIGQ